MVQEDGGGILLPHRCRYLRLMATQTEEVSVLPQGTMAILIILLSVEMDYISGIPTGEAWECRMDKEGSEWECMEEEVRRGTVENRKCQSPLFGSSRSPRLT